MGLGEDTHASGPPSIDKGPQRGSAGGEGLNPGVGSLGPAELRRRGDAQRVGSLESTGKKAN